MPLWTPPPMMSGIGDDNYGAITVTSGLWGIDQITSHASDGTIKGAIGEMIASTTHESFYMMIICATTQAWDNIDGAVLDILIGASGSEIVLIPNLVLAELCDFGGEEGPSNHAFPLYIPKGSRLSARVAADTSAKQFNVAIWLFGEAYRMSVCGSRVETMGADTVPDGTVLTSTDGSFSAWQEIEDSTANEYIALMPSISRRTTSDINYWSVQMGIGAAGNEQVIGPTYYCGSWSTARGGSIVGPFPNLPYIGRIPAGSRLVMRSATRNAASSLEVALHGVLP